MNITYTKKGKGHDVKVNGDWIFWVAGSKKHAKDEFIIWLREYNEFLKKEQDGNSI